MPIRADDVLVAVGGGRLSVTRCSSGVHRSSRSSCSVGDGPPGEVRTVAGVAVAGWAANFSSSCAASPSYSRSCGPLCVRSPLQAVVSPRSPSTRAAWPRNLPDGTVQEHLALALGISPATLSRVAQYSAQLDGVFVALADPTRRAVIRRLGRPHKRRRAGPRVPDHAALVHEARADPRDERADPHDEGPAGSVRACSTGSDSPSSRTGSPSSAASGRGAPIGSSVRHRQDGR